MTNKDLNNWMMYHEIHRLSRLGFKAARIGRYLSIDRRTVEKRLPMDQQAYERFLLRGQYRPKRLSPYEDFVKSKLEAFADTSTAQMFDWLKERYADLPKVSTRAVYNFVMYVRGKYNIPVVPSQRDYFPVEELYILIEIMAPFSINIYTVYRIIDSMLTRTRFQEFFQKNLSAAQ